MKQINLAIAKDMIKPSGHFERLLDILDTNISELEANSTKILLLEKTTLLAEFINNDLDLFAKQTHESKSNEILNWMITDDFKIPWNTIKVSRDKLYDRLKILQKKFGKENLEKGLIEYVKLNTQYI